MYELNYVERKEYPINPYEEQIVTTLLEEKLLIVKAPTGSGKSTQIPQMCYNLTNDDGKRRFERIIVVGPTRNFASTLAEWTAKELGSKLGTVVGYKTGYEKLYSEETVILYTTEGTELMNELHNSNINYEDCLLIFDEVQEWSIPTETLVAWAKKMIESGVKLNLIMMSATADTENLSNFFNHIPVLDIPGKLFNIDKYYRKASEFENSIAELVKAGRHVLAFLPGKREIDQTMHNLKIMGLDANYIILHGDLPLSEQQRVFEIPTTPTVVLATNVAQQAITIPYIDAVVDRGLERRMQIIDGLPTLAVGVTSRSDCDQRAGRAGRTKDGIYIRCNDTPISELDEYPPPDIYAGSIDQIVLHLASIGVDARDVTFYHQPPLEKIMIAQKTLRMLGAFDENNNITECGKIMAKLPISVRYARMLVEAAKRNVLDDVVTIACLLEFGGIKSSKAKYPDFSKEMKSDILAEFDCFNMVHKQVINLENTFDIFFDNQSKDPFVGVQERIYYRVRELRSKLADILYNIYGDLPNTGNRNDILKSCIAGLVDLLYVRGSNNWYSNPNDAFDRKLNLNTATFPGPYLVGLPKNISKGNDADKTLYIISYASMVTPEMLEDVTPHLCHNQTRIEFDYQTNQYLIKDVRFFGDVEIGSTNSKLTDSTLKREALAKWLALMTFDDDACKKAKLDKGLLKVINKNYGIFEDMDEATTFYIGKLKKFSESSLPNLKRCKDFAFLQY